MGVTPLTFTGTSQYSSDFQSILNRAVAISSIPLQQLENQDTTVLNKKTQLGSLGSAVASLTSAVQALGTLGTSQAISASSSNSSVVSVTSNSASAPESYTINSVTSLATAASETSVTGYADSSATPVSSTGTLQLVVGSNQYTINLTPQNNNLVGLQNVINSLGAGVSASILTTGNGNYLSVSANNFGATTLQLFDDPTGAHTNLVTSANQGTDAVFQLNNLSVSRTQNTINDLIPGATLTLHAQTSTPVTVNLASDPYQITGALDNLVTAYNAVVDQVNSQTGPNAGVLRGDTELLQVESALRAVSGYQTSGPIPNLAALGITLGSDGKMSFDPSAVSGLSNSQLAGAFQFLGSATTGLGGVSQTLSAISDPLFGTIANEQASLTQSDQNLQNQIASTGANINSMQAALLQQLSQSDSLITQLTAQQNELTASVQSLNYVMFGKSSNSN